MLQHFYIILYRLYSWKSVALKLFNVKPSLFPNQQRNDTCVYELRLEIGKALAQWKDCTLALWCSAWLFFFLFKLLCVDVVPAGQLRVMYSPQMDGS